MPPNVGINGKPLVKGVSIESPKSMRHAWGVIFTFMRRYRTMFLFGMMLIVIESLLNVFSGGFPGVSVGNEPGTFSGEKGFQQFRNRFQGSASQQERTGLKSFRHGNKRH